MPLVLFPVAPEDEDTRQENSETEREPSAIWDFGESRRKIETVKGAENEEAGDDYQEVQAPDDQGYKRHHGGGDEGNEDDTDAVGFSELRGLLMRSSQLRCKTIDQWGVGGGK